MITTNSNRARLRRRAISLESRGRRIAQLPRHMNMSRREEVPLIQIASNLMRARFGEWVAGPKANFLLVRTYAELAAGRWERFISIEEEE